MLLKKHKCVGFQKGAPSLTKRKKENKRETTTNIKKGLTRDKPAFTKEQGVTLFRIPESRNLISDVILDPS